MKIPKGQCETVNRRTDVAYTQNKIGQKKQKYSTKHYTENCVYKLSNINSPKTVVNSGVPKVKLCPAPLVTPMVFSVPFRHILNLFVVLNDLYYIRVKTKLPNSEQSNKGKVKTHKYINRQNHSTTGKL